jgi:L-threonylcarbamoyladenylate synthase
LGRSQRSTLSIDEGAALLQKGELVAFSTETVYGLGASIEHPQAIDSLFKVKGRPLDNPLIVHLYSLDQLTQVAGEIPKSFFKLYKAFMPGPLTVVLPKKEGLSDTITRGLPTVAVRFPKHPVAQSLLQKVRIPLVAPSANLSGKPSPTCAEHVWDDFQDKIAGVVDGGSCEGGLESTVVSLVGSDPVLLRPGSITKEALEQVLGREVLRAGNQTPIHSPGMKYRHYAPNAEVFLVDLPPIGEINSIYLEKGIAAPKLYAFLRACDQKGIKKIFIRRTPEMDRDEALMNRLQKITTRV